jgi:hypothetical protein
VRVIEGVDNPLQHCIGISQHLVVPEAKDPKAPLGQERCPTLIGLNVQRVLPAIQLDGQPVFRAAEINDVPANRVLAAELGPDHLSGS